MDVDGTNTVGNATAGRKRKNPQMHVTALRFKVAQTVLQTLIFIQPGVRCASNCLKTNHAVFTC